MKIYLRTDFEVHFKDTNIVSVVEKLGVDRLHNSHYRISEEEEGTVVVSKMVEEKLSEEGTSVCVGSVELYEHNRKFIDTFSLSTYGNAVKTCMRTYITHGEGDINL